MGHGVLLLNLRYDYMTKNDFILNGEAIHRRAHVTDDHHAYFELFISRLYRSCELFGLFSVPLGDVLEIGPFYGYIPFLLRPRASSYTVLEGDDPAIYPLVPFYKESAITFSCVDFFELFGPVHAAMHRLPATDASYDTILCWETLEHFNFNPVKFIRELQRVLKPGGRLCITVPNRASFHEICSLLFRRGEKEKIDAYFCFENYESNGKKAFYGFHWREYTPSELALLFAQSGFEVQACKSFTVFQDLDKPSFGRRLARFLSQLGTRLLPRFGTHVYLIATKKPSALN